MVISMNYALINTAGLVVNVIVLVNPANYKPPSGQRLIQIPAGIAAGIGWTYADGQFTPPPAPEPVPPTPDEQRAARFAAYTREADPLYFKAQRGEATIEEWEAKVADIRARYPMPPQD